VPVSLCLVHASLFDALDLLNLVLRHIGGDLRYSASLRLFKLGNQEPFLLLHGARQHFGSAFAISTANKRRKRGFFFFLVFFFLCPSLKILSLVLHAFFAR
jgi:hypothetical protein